MTRWAHGLIGAILPRQASIGSASMARDPSPLRVLYVCYLSLEDPLVHSQVVAYLAGLAERGHVVHLMTFEPTLARKRSRQFAEDLRRRGIVWHRRRYHKRPSLPATAFDVIAGGLAAARLVRRHRLDAIHARNHMPAAMALIAARFARFRLIFDLRGLMAEEYADAGNWKRGGLPYRLTQWVQRAALQRADGVVTLTEAVRPHLSAAKAGPEMTFVIPCCADVEQISERASERADARAELGIGTRPAMVYVGKFTGWYMEREMADFLSVARRSQPDLLFLIVTQADPGPMLRELDRNGIGAADYRILRAEPEEIGRYLAAADVGLSFIRPCFSKISSSPTKIGEYLAAGLPVVSTAGIGDVDALLRDNRVGALVEDLSISGYEVTLAALRELREDPALRERCTDVAGRNLALREVGIPRYDALYCRLADG
jgi:glycosyltransferase involved in cell wall biosynthesis